MVNRTSKWGTTKAADPRQAALKSQLTQKFFPMLLL